MRRIETAVRAGLLAFAMTWAGGAAHADTVLVQWQTNLRPPDIEGITKLVNRFHEHLQQDLDHLIEAQHGDR